MLKKALKSPVVKNLAFPLATVLIVLLVGLFIPRFLSSRNLVNILKQSSVTAIAAVAQTVVIITGGIDLSCGSIITFSGMINAILLVNGVPIWVSVPVALLVCSVFGAVSGVTATKLKVPPFISTLVIGNIAAGIAMILCKGSSFANLPAANKFLGSGKILSLPFPVWAMVIFAVGGTLLMTRTSFGNQVYGIGNSRKVVKNEGINTDKVLIKVYMFSGFCAAAAGLVLCGWLNGCHPTQGAYYQLDIIAATVIGGTNMLGGEGKIINSVMGAIIISVIRNMLNLMAVNAYITNLLVGGVIIVVVAFTVFMARRSQKTQSTF